MVFGLGARFFGLASVETVTSLLEDTERDMTGAETLASCSPLFDAFSGSVLASLGAASSTCAGGVSQEEVEEAAGLAPRITELKIEKGDVLKKAGLASGDAEGRGGEYSWPC
jgi:hypothetical protein